MTSYKSFLRRSAELLLFFLATWLVFKAAFFLGTTPSLWIGVLFQTMTDFVLRHVPYEDIKNFLVFGFLAGLGGFLVYFPNILILFLFSRAMEKSGLAKVAARIIQPLLRPLGLSGASFVPLLLGFGCTVATLHAAGNIKDRNSRMLTMLMAPFLSCGAKYGVYILLISALFSPGEAGTVLFLLYFLGLTLSVATAAMLKRWAGLSLPQGEMDEPSPLRFPPVIETLGQTLRDGWVFLKSAGTVIVLAAIVVWALTYWPGIPKKEYEILKNYAVQTGQPLPSRSSLAIHHSYARKLGHLFEPVFSSLGQDWKSSVALIGGLTGKEVVVSTFITLYGMEHGPGSKKTLARIIRENGQFTKLSAGSLMIFVLLSGSCLASMTMLYRHTRSFKQLLFFVCYPVAVAWIVSTLFYQTGRLITG